jgi:hypothetical protein
METLRPPDTKNCGRNSCWNGDRLLVEIFSNWRWKVEKCWVIKSVYRKMVSRGCDFGNALICAKNLTCNLMMWVIWLKSSRRLSSSVHSRSAISYKNGKILNPSLRSLSMETQRPNLRSRSKDTAWKLSKLRLGKSGKRGYSKFAVLSSV